MSRNSDNGRCENGRPQPPAKRTFTLSAEAYEWLVFLRRECFTRNGDWLSLDAVLNVCLLATGENVAGQIAYWPTEQKS